MSRSICALMLSTSVCVPYAAAQTVEPFVLDPITVEGGDGSAVADDGGNAIDIDAGDLALQNPTDLQDLFIGEPTTIVGSSLPVSQKLYVNGVEETNLAVTIDGARQNNKIFHHNATTLIDPALLEAVSVDSGVAAADAGPGALAGSISYETIDVDSLLEEGDSFGGKFATEYQSNGDIFANALTLYGRTGNFEALGYLKYAEGDGREDGDDNTITGSGTNLLSGLVKLAYEADAGHRIEFSYESVGDDEERPFRANFDRTFLSVRDYDLQRQNIVLTYTDETPQGWWDPTISIAYSVTELLTPFDDSFSYGGTTDSINGKFQNEFALNLGTITAGIDFYSETANLEEFDLADSANDTEIGEEAWNIGAFSQARLDLTDAARVSFGARVDANELEGLDGTTYSNEGVSGNVSGEVDVTDAVTLSAGVSSVWGGVALAENYLLNTAWTYPDEIEPVTSQNIFVASEANFGRWNLNAKLFKTEIDDVRTESFSEGAGITNDMSSEGFEIGAGYAWNDGLVRIGYANIDTEVNGETADAFSGIYLTTPVGEIITLQVNHTFANRGITIGADAEIVLEETDVAEGSATLPAYEVFNSFITYTPPNDDSWVLRAEINNMFDETYASRATYGLEFPSLVPLNEPGQTIMLSASKTF